MTFCDISTTVYCLINVLLSLTDEYEKKYKVENFFFENMISDEKENEKRNCHNEEKDVFLILPYDTNDPL